MLIRSQDKKTLTKFSFINIFPTKGLIHNFDEDESVEIIAFIGHGSNFIGTYSTEEKAIKVLDMIQETYKGNRVEEVYHEGSDYFRPVFQMPQDSEV